MKKLSSILFLTLVTIAAVYAQPKYTTKDKWAIRNYEAGLTHYDKYNYEKATEELKKAIEKDNRFIEPYLVLVNVYVEQKMYDEAIEQYKTVVAIDPNFFPSSYFNLANIEVGVGKYEDAKAHYEAFLSLKSAKEPLITRAKQRIESCDFAINSILSLSPR